MCQCRPSASVHSGEKMIWQAKAIHGHQKGLPRPCPPSVPTIGQKGTNLVTGLAAWAQAFGMVATTVDLASMVEVDEVHQ